MSFEIFSLKGHKSTPLQGLIKRKYVLQMVFMKVLAAL